MDFRKLEEIPIKPGDTVRRVTTNNNAHRVGDLDVVTGVSVDQLHFANGKYGALEYYKLVRPKDYNFTPGDIVFTPGDTVQRIAQTSSDASQQPGDVDFVKAIDGSGNLIFVNSVYVGAPRNYILLESADDDDDI